MKITQEELIQQKAIGEIARDAFLDFGNYINNQRHTAFIQDGCKPSYRRLIYSALQFPKGKMIPSTTVISSVANYHPHSLSGIEELNAKSERDWHMSPDEAIQFGIIDVKI